VSLDDAYATNTTILEDWGERVWRDRAYVHWTSQRKKK
jgi:hypothetical protein